MAYQLKTECITCGHSIPLGDSYCGVDDCLNRYAQDNEHPDFSYAGFQAWQAVDREAHAEVVYHEWVVAHRDLARLESQLDHEPDDADERHLLRQALFPSSKAA